MKAIKAKCDICPLAKSIFVPSEIHESGIILLTEAPGYTETIEGKPLVGVAGQDLDRIVESVGQTREFASYLNSVSCRPTQVKDGRLANRTPTIEEINCCNERLIYEIEQINPIVIVAMGKTPYIALGRTVYPGFLMADIVSGEFMFMVRDYKVKVISTYHPAAISHVGGLNSNRGNILAEHIQHALNMALKTKDAGKQLKLL